MKKKIGLLLGALTLLMTVAASAGTIKLRANVPFNFIVNGATLPAGEYAIETMDEQGFVLSIRDLNSTAKSLIVVHSCQSLAVMQETKLIFHRYGDRYFLNKVWVSGNNIGHELPASPRETEVAKDFSMQEVVLMAARR
jgi:hypothetical protein